MVFNGDGSFSFNDGATINPNANGSFTFEIDVIADGSLTFDLTGGGLVQIDGTFTTTNAGTILAEGGFVEINGETISGEGTDLERQRRWFQLQRRLQRDRGADLRGPQWNRRRRRLHLQRRELPRLVQSDLATFDAATVNFNGVTTIAAGYGFDLNNAAVVTFNDFIAEGDHTINFLDADSTFTVDGDASFIDSPPSR